MFSECNWHNFLIYYNNLSTYYVFCVLISIIAVILTWFYHLKTIKLKTNDDDVIMEEIEEEIVETTEETRNGDLENILQTFKHTRKQTMETIAANLTEDQLVEEKQAEREQLAAILKLLKQQEDKFQVGSMEELEGQLKLYR